MKAVCLMLFLLLFNIQLSEVNISTVLYIESSEAVTTNTLYVNNMKNNNPFNIRKNDSNHWLGKVYDNNGAFEQFTNIEYGIRAGLKLLQNYYNKYNLNTIEKLIYKFAPPSENDTTKYINFICNHTGYEPDTVIDLNNKTTLFSVAKYILIMESNLIIDPKLLQQAFIML